jgi:phosphoribosylamine--glycine ligase
MKILVIGSGGREHTLVWKLAREAGVKKILAAPGNGGTQSEDKCRNIPVPDGDIASEEGLAFLLNLAKKEAADLTIVGPEAPLAAGIVDRFREAGLAIAGPDREAARLEASKVFSKDFMVQYGVRTPRSKAFRDYKAALNFASRHFSDITSGAPPPLVVKADGLAAGKGVVIAKDIAEAEAALRAFMEEGALGEAGAQVLLEEHIAGAEVSVLAAVSAAPGKKAAVLPFVSAKDHKRRFDGGEGPNTGGMGAIAPSPDFGAALEKDFRLSVLEPTLRGLEDRCLDYRGFIFFGLMVEKNRCHLLEYNVRLGDPETQAVLPLMEGNLSGLCAAILEHRLEDFSLSWKPGAVCAPVAVAGGYPGPYPKGVPISIDQGALEKTGVRLFFAGADLSGGQLRTAGGRVLAASAWGADLNQARTRAYGALQAVSFEGMDYRRDIGA